MALELRPAHDPTRTHGFVNTVISVTDLSANIFTWYLDGENWLAMKMYGGDVMLLWSAGSTRRLDERWDRVNAIMHRVSVD